ncbi:MAG: phosphate ABC transporter ATP-binding protein [Chloroflexi bacterium]|nr:phosphate ABC transporter ATP-binding protein [Chloroflexota bacterium]
MSTLLYELEHVAMAYDGRDVLDLDWLEVYQGEVLCLVGPSGAGKSTLLRILNFLEPPTRGTVRFAGRPYGAMDPMPLGERRLVTTVFQRAMLLNRSVWANVAYGLRLRGQRDEHDAISAALEQVGLRSLARRRANTLSAGEAQRVALARAIVLQPQVLLLDEPTANLDPYNVGQIESIVRDLNRRAGTTVVLVTHNTFQAKRLATRVGLLLEGRLVEVSEATHFFESPSDPRTAAFVSGELVC